jgi:drug/metabolite transporter (DMT)-like permease
VPRVGMLVLSAFLGIAIGDIVWLQALQSLGARKLILVDSVKVTQ